MADGKQQVSDAVVDAIKRSVETTTIEIDGVDFLTRQVYDPPAPSKVETLNIATLTGLVEFVRTQKPTLTNGVVIQVEGPNAVAVKGPISDDRAGQRDVFARATVPNPFDVGFALGRFQSLGDMLIALKCLFGDAGDRDAIVSLLGNVTGSQIAEGADNGFSQAVTVRRGVVKVGTEEVKNPVTLQPYRTFKEIEQVESEFVLRLQGDKDNEKPPAVALFDCDSQQWKADAIEAIVTYLKQELPDEVVIG